MSGHDSDLVAVLNKAGMITDDQSRRLRERARNTSDKALAMRLIGARYVTQAEIVSCIKQHILDVVYDLMSWSEGPFRFDDGQTPDNRHILVPIDLENVIIEGARRVREVEELNKVIPNLDMALRFPENPREKFKGIHLSVDEWKVVSYVNPKNTIRQIMKALNMSEMEIKKVVYGLEQAGLVDIIRPLGAGKRQTGQHRISQQPQVQKQVVTKLIDKLRSL